MVASGVEERYSSHNSTSRVARRKMQEEGEVDSDESERFYATSMAQIASFCL